MAQKIDVPIPEGIDIGDGWQIVWDAVDPNTGASVSGVKVSNANVCYPPVGGQGGGGTEEPLGPFMLVPGPGA